MITTKAGYRYITRDWSSGTYQERELLPINYGNLMPLLDRTGYPTTAPMQCDVYHMVETATMLANAVHFRDATKFNGSTAENFNSQANERKTFLRLADFAKNFATSTLGYFALQPDADPSAAMLNLYDSQYAAREAIFDPLGVTRTSDPANVLRIPNKDDLDKIYHDLNISRLLSEDLSKWTKAAVDAAFGHYEEESDSSPILGPHVTSPITKTTYEKDGEEWTHTTETFTDFVWGGHLRYWHDGEVYQYDAYTYPTVWFQVNRTSSPADFVRLYEFAKQPKLYASFSVEGKDDVRRPRKWGWVEVPSFSQSASGHAFSVVPNLSSLCDTIHEMYKLAVPEYRYKGGDYGYLDIRILGYRLDTGAMTLPTALPTD